MPKSLRLLVLLVSMGLVGVAVWAAQSAAPPAPKASGLVTVDHVSAAEAEALDALEVALANEAALHEAWLKTLVEAESVLRDLPDTKPDAKPGRLPAKKPRKLPDAEQSDTVFLGGTKSDMMSGIGGLIAPKGVKMGTRGLGGELEARSDTEAPPPEPPAPSPP